MKDVTCEYCGRPMYINEICKVCSLDIYIQDLEKIAKENPDQKKWVERKIKRLLIHREFQKMERNHNLKGNEFFAIADKLRAKVRNKIRAKNIDLLETYFDLISCTPLNLREHLEKQFEEGMNWNNYGIGGWHIEHIKPCQEFDLTDPKDQKECFHYSNLQPMWAMENFKKNGKHNKK